MPHLPQETVAGEALDFGANRAHLLTSYALRGLGLLVFAPLFALLIAAFHPGLPLEVGTLLAIGITGWLPSR